MYSSVVLAISLMLAASAFAQTHKFKDHQHSETDDVSDTTSINSTTDSGEDPAATDPPEAPVTTDPATKDPAATDPPEEPAVTDPNEDPSTSSPSGSVFDSMSDDVCPAMLDPVVVENFRLIAPELVQRCEALRDAPPSPTTPTTTSPPPTSDQSPLPSDQNALSPDALGTVPVEEGSTTGSTQP